MTMIGALLCIACCIAPVATQDAKPERPPTETPHKKSTEVEELREEVVRKRKELADLSEIARLRNEVATLERKCKELEPTRMTDAEREVLRNVTIPKLLEELRGLEEAKKLKREEASLRGKLKWARMTPKQREKAEAKRNARINKLRDDLAKPEAVIQRIVKEIWERETDIKFLLSNTMITDRYRATQITLKKKQITAYQKRIREAQKQVRRLTEALKAEELPPTDDFAQANVTNKAYREALNLRPAWFPKVRRNSAKSAMAPDGTWWCIRMNGGYLELRNFGKGFSGKTSAMGWEQYYSQGGK